MQTATLEHILPLSPTPHFPIEHSNNTLSPSRLRAEQPSHQLLTAPLRANLPHIHPSNLQMSDDDDELFLSLATPIQDIDMEAAKRELHQARTAMPSLTDLDSKKARMKALKYQEKQQQAGIVSLGRIPPNCGPTFIKEALSAFGKIGRVYLKPFTDQHGKSSKRSRFERGWVEFLDKRHAKKAAYVLHGQTMNNVSKLRHLRDEMWVIEYLSKIKWDDLRLQHQHEKELHNVRSTKALDEGRQETTEFLRNYQKSKEQEQYMAIKQKKKLAKSQRGGDNTVYNDDQDLGGPVKRKFNHDQFDDDDDDDDNDDDNLDRPISRPKLNSSTSGTSSEGKMDSSTFRKLL